MACCCSGVFAGRSLLLVLVSYWAIMLEGMMELLTVLGCALKLDIILCY